MSFKKLTLAITITASIFIQIPVNTSVVKAEEVNPLSTTNTNLSNNIYKERRANLISKLKDNSILLIESGNPVYKSQEFCYPFTPSKNFYYLTGTSEEYATLVVFKKNNEIKETLFSRYSKPGKSILGNPGLSLDEITKISGITDIQPSNNYFKNKFNILNTREFNNLYLDVPSSSSKSYSEDSFIDTILQSNPNISIVNVNGTMADLRQIKDKEECETIKKAIDISCDGIKYMMSNVKPEMMEYELEAYFDFTLNSKGVRDHAFPSIIASGKNAIMRHYSDNNDKINNNDLILCDVGAEYNYYSSDITRTFPANGKFTERQKELYNIVLKAQLETIKAVKPGITYKELQAVTRKVLLEECKNIGIVKDEKELLKCFTSASHPIGLDVHDFSSASNGTLKEGFIIAIEPGLYIEEENIGIRIEDNVLVTQNGCEVLSKDLIKTVDEIENFMRKK